MIDARELMEGYSYKYNTTNDLYDNSIIIIDKIFPHVIKATVEKNYKSDKFDKTVITINKSKLICNEEKLTPMF